MVKFITIYYHRLQIVVELFGNFSVYRYNFRLYTHQPIVFLYNFVTFFPQGFLLVGGGT